MALLLLLALDGRGGIRLARWALDSQLRGGDQALVVEVEWAERRTHARDGYEMTLFDRA